jgi:hypothetical protein
MKGPVFKKFWDQLIRFDVEFLARTSGLIESLADTTVICSIDREGTISRTFPCVEKVFYIAESGESKVMDVVEFPSGLGFEGDELESNLKYFLVVLIVYLVVF